MLSRPGKHKKYYLSTKRRTFMNKQELSKVSVEEVRFSKETLSALKKNKLQTIGALTFMASEDL